MREINQGADPKTRLIAVVTAMAETFFDLHARPIRSGIVFKVIFSSRITSSDRMGRGVNTDAVVTGNSLPAISLTAELGALLLCHTCRRSECALVKRGRHRTCTHPCPRAIHHPVRPTACENAARQTHRPREGASNNTCPLKIPAFARYTAHDHVSQFLENEIPIV